MAVDRDPLAEQIRRVIERAGSDAPGSEAVDRQMGTSLVAGAHARASSRPRWLVPAAAALVAVGGVSLVVMSRSDDERREATDASSTSTASDPTDPTDASATPTAETVTTTTESSSSTGVPTTDMGAIAQATVPETIDRTQLERTVLWEAGIGSGADQLGLERDGCGACAAPWAPIVLDDGTILIPDAVNARWVTVQDGIASATPLAAGDAFVGQPVWDGGSTVYAPIARTDGTYTVVVAMIDRFDLASVTEEFPVSHGPFVKIAIDGARLVENMDGEIARLPVPVNPVTTTRSGDARIDVSAFGGTTAWTLTGAWVGQTEILGGLSDGTVVLRGPDEAILRIAPDGTVGTGTLGGVNMSENGSVTLSDAGLVRLEMDDALERWQLVRYSLPSMPADAAPACTADAVDVRFGASDGAMGTRYLPLLATNSSEGACRLADTPTIVALDGGDQPIDRVQFADPSTSFTFGPLLGGVLYPDATAVSVLRWSVMCEDDPSGAGGLVPTVFEIDLGAGARVRVDNIAGVDLTCGLLVPRFEWADPSWMT